MPTPRARLLAALAIAAAAFTALAAPAGAEAAGSALDEYTLDLPGGNTAAPQPDQSASPIAGSEGDGGPQAGVTGEAGEARSPLGAALHAPYAGIGVAALLATLTFGLLMGSERTRLRKR
jgi:hypothetical protein